MPLSLITTVSALRVLIGIAGAGYSIYSNLVSSPDGGASGRGRTHFEKIPEAIFSQVVGGAFYDCLKSGSADAYDRFLHTIDNYNPDQLNHDLLRAVRKSVLIATYLACQNCLNDIKRDEDWWTNVKATIGMNAEIAFLAAASKDLKLEITNIDKHQFDFGFSYADVFSIFDGGDVRGLRNTNNGNFIRQLKDQILEEIRTTYYSVSFSEEAFNRIKTALDRGWQKTVETDALFIELNLTKRGKTVKSYDWFNLVRVIFDEEFKVNERVAAVLEKEALETHTRLLTRIEKKLHSIGQIATFDLLEDLLKQNTERLEVFQTRIFEKLTVFLNDHAEESRQYLSEIKQDTGLLPEIHELLIRLAGEHPTRHRRGNLIGDTFALAIPDVFVGRQHLKRLKELQSAVFNGRETIINVISPPGYGKAALVNQLVTSAVKEGRVVDPRIHDIIIISVKNYDGDVLAIIAAKIDDLCKRAGLFLDEEPLMREFSTDPNEISGRNLRGKCIQIVNRFFRLGTVWLILDGGDEWLKVDDEETQLELFLVEVNKHKYAAQTGDLPKVLVTTVKHISQLPNVRKLLLDEEFSQDDAIECLEKMAEARGFDWKFPEGKVKGYLTEIVKQEELRIPACLFSFAAYFESQSSDRSVVLIEDVREWIEIAKKNFQDDWLAYLKQEVRFLTTRAEDAKNIDLEAPDRAAKVKRTQKELLVWFALSVFRKPVSVADLVTMFSGFANDLDENAIFETLEKYAWFIRRNNKYILERGAREIVYDEMLKASSLVNYKALLRFHFHIRAAEIYERQIGQLDVEQVQEYEELEPYLEGIHHRIESKHYGKAAFILSRIDFRFLLKRGYIRTVLDYRTQLEHDTYGKPELLELKIKSRFLLAHHYNSLGVAQELTGDKTAGIRNIEKAVTIYEELEAGNNKAQGRALLNLGEAYSSLGNKNEAEIKYYAALRLQGRAKDASFTSRTYLNLGLLYRDTNRIQGSEHQFTESLKLLGNDPWFRGRVLLNIGISNGFLGKFETAKQQFEEAMKLHIASRDTMFRGRNHGNLAEILLVEAFLKDGRNKIAEKDNLLAEAESLLHRSINIARETGDKDSERRRLLRLGIIYQDREDFVRAIECYDNVLEINIPTGNTRALLLKGIVGLEMDKARPDVIALFDASIQACDKLAEISADYYVPILCRYIATIALEQDSDKATRSAKEILRKFAAVGVFGRCLPYIKFLRRANHNFEVVDEIYKLTLKKIETGLSNYVKTQKTE